MSSLAIRFFHPKEQSKKQWVATVLFGTTILALWVVSLLGIGFNLIIYTICMLAVCGLVFVTPRAGLPIILLGTMWFERWFTLQPIVLGDVIVKIYPLDFVFIATCLGLLFHHLFGRKKLKLTVKKIELILIGFIGLCLIYLARAFVDGLADNSLAISSFKNYAFYAGLYFLVSLTVTNLHQLKQIIKVLLIGGWGIILFIAIGFIRGQGLWTEYTPLSTDGIRLLAFPHAFYLSIVLVISLVFLTYRLLPYRVALFTMWIQLAGVLGSLMRHLWLALFSVAIFLFLVLPKKAKAIMMRFFAKNVALVFFVSVVIAFLFVIFPFASTTDKLQSITDPLVNRATSLARSAADSSARWRFFAWRAARESITDYPIQGVGYGRELVVEFDTYRVTIPMRDLHNSLLVLVVQMGLIGGLVFLYLLWTTFVHVYRSWRNRGMYFPYHIAFFSALMLFLLSSLTQPYFETNLTGIFFWILLGLFIVSLRIEVENDRIQIVGE